MGAYEFSNPAADSDGDNVSDYEEMIADTDAANSNDYFHVTSISNNSPTTIYFDSSINREYTLVSCTNLSSKIWTEVPGTGPRKGNGPNDYMTDTNTPNKKTYYRLKVIY